MSQKHNDNLKEKINTLILSVGWLKHSYEQCAIIGIKHGYTIEEVDAFENLTSRYVRTTDMLTAQVLRALDAVELVTHGTILDIINRAEKRGLVPAASILRNLKDLRNEIAHEYQIEKIEMFFEQVLNSTPVLLEIIEKTVEYSKQYTIEP